MTFRVGRFLSIAALTIGFLLALIGVLLLVWEPFMNEFGFLRDYPAMYLLSLLMIIFGVLICGYFLFRGFSNPEEEGRDLIEYDRKFQLRQESDSERWARIRMSRPTSRSCQHCGKMNMDIAVFCEFCGNMMIEEKTQALQNRVVCPICNHANPANSKRCEFCRHDMFMVVQCLNCGKSIPFAEPFCPHCGYEWKSSRMSRKDEVKKCEVCGLYSAHRIQGTAKSDEKCPYCDFDPHKMEKMEMREIRSRVEEEERLENLRKYM